jgi:hypothetical protein
MLRKFLAGLGIVFFIMVLALFATAIKEAYPQDKGCVNMLNDPRTYGNWQNAQQQGDRVAIQRQNAWGNYLEKSGQPSWLVDDARAKQRLMENSADSSKRYNEFFGPHNKYGK